jgi:hypothetical protein
MHSLDVPNLGAKEGCSLAGNVDLPQDGCNAGHLPAVGHDGGQPSPYPAVQKICRAYTPLMWTLQ